MNTKEKQSRNVLANKEYQNQNPNTDDDFLNPKGPKELEYEDIDIDEEDLEEEAEHPVDNPGNDFNEIEEEVEDEDEEDEEDEEDDVDKDSE